MKVTLTYKTDRRYTQSYDALGLSLRNLELDGSLGFAVNFNDGKERTATFKCENWDIKIENTDIRSASEPPIFLSTYDVFSELGAAAAKTKAAMDKARRELLEAAKQIDDALTSATLDEPIKRTYFVHLPQTIPHAASEKTYLLGLALSNECPSNDCTVYRNIFNMAQQLDNSLDYATAHFPEVAVDALKTALRQRWNELYTMFTSNYAIKSYLKEHKDVFN